MEIKKNINSCSEDKFSRITINKFKVKTRPEWVYIDIILKS